MDFSALLSALSSHKWIVVAALVITALVRLFKSDTPLPFGWVVPPRYRVWLALGLGIVAGVLNAGIAGTPWQTAILQGLGAAISAILGHEFLVESLRGGREFFTPVAPPGGPTSGAGGTGGSGGGPVHGGPVGPGGAYRVSLPELVRWRAKQRRPALALGGMVASVALLVASLSGCAAWTTVKPVVKTILDDTQLACILANAIYPTATVATVCKVDAVLVPYLDSILGAQRAALKLQAQVRGEACAPAASASAASSVKP